MNIRRLFFETFDGCLDGANHAVLLHVFLTWLGNGALDTIAERDLALKTCGVDPPPAKEK